MHVNELTNRIKPIARSMHLLSCFNTLSAVYIKEVKSNVFMYVFETFLLLGKKTFASSHLPERSLGKSRTRLGSLKKKC